MKRRITIFALMLLILLPLLHVNAQKIYYIEKESELFMLENDPNGIYYLACDISITKSHKPQFTSKEKPFAGVLDGNGFSISFCNIEGDGVVALIGYSSGEIKNVKLVNSSVNTQNANAVAAGIVAYNYGTVSDCSFSGEVMKNGDMIYGVGVYGQNHGRISNCNDDIFLLSASGDSSENNGLSLEGNTSIPAEVSSEVGVSVSSEPPVSSESNKFIFDEVVDDNPPKDDTAAVVLVSICLVLIGTIVALAVVEEIKAHKNKSKEK